MLTFVPDSLTLLNNNDLNDILVGSDGDNIINSGYGDSLIRTGNGEDRVYIDHTNDGDSQFIDFSDTDNAEDHLFFGNDTNIYGEQTLGNTFVSVSGWGEEDRIVFREFDEGDFYFVRVGTNDTVIDVSLDGTLSTITIENWTQPINIIEA